MGCLVGSVEWHSGIGNLMRKTELPSQNSISLFRSTDQFLLLQKLFYCILHNSSDKKSTWIMYGIKHAWTNKITNTACHVYHHGIFVLWINNW